MVQEEVDETAAGCATAPANLHDKLKDELLGGEKLDGGSCVIHKGAAHETLKPARLRLGLDPVELREICEDGKWRVLILQGLPDKLLHQQQQGGALSGAGTAQEEDAFAEFLIGHAEGGKFLTLTLETPGDGGVRVLLEREIHEVRRALSTLGG